MAVSIDQLPLAGNLQPTDKLLVQQSNQSKALQTEVLKKWLLEVAQSLGGFSKPVEKIGTDGLVDTYQFTYVDGTTSTFTLRNGSSIDHISLLGAVDLVDTYKVWLTDGTFTTFQVKNARSITSIEQLPSPNGDTILKINFNVGASSQFTVSKGKDGISSYVQIAYADQRPDESHPTIRQSPTGPWMGIRIAVLNQGSLPPFNSDYRVYEWANIKGAPGKQSYIWIKYAANKPTVERPEFGDTPDRWMGIAYGSDSVAPDDWRRYQWYDRGGLKGDPGQGIESVSYQYWYQCSDNGTTPPEGVWLDSIPEQKKSWLWTKIRITFHPINSSVTYYQVTHTNIPKWEEYVVMVVIPPQSWEPVQYDGSTVFGANIGQEYVGASIGGQWVMKKNDLLMLQNSSPDSIICGHAVMSSPDGEPVIMFNAKVKPKYTNREWLWVRRPI